MGPSGEGLRGGVFSIGLTVINDADGATAADVVIALLALILDWVWSLDLKIVKFCPITKVRH